MNDKVKKRNIPVMEKGKLKTTLATFYPDRTPRDSMVIFKLFLKTYDGGTDLHKCPHATYIEAASWWKDTGRTFSEPSGCGAQLVLWKEYLEDQGLL